MLRVLQHQTYGRLFGAQVVALLGTGLATVAIGLLAFDLSGEQASSVLGAVFTIKMIAYVLIAPVMATALNHIPRSTVMIGSDLVRVGVAALLPFINQVWHLFALVLILQAASATFTPTFQSVIPLVLHDEDDYTQALSLSRLAYDLESIVSPLVATALLVFMPANALFGGTAIGFLASACLIGSACLPKRLGLQTQQRGPDLLFGTRARAGVMTFLTTPTLRPLIALDICVAFSGAFVIVQTVIITQSHFGLDQAMVAVLLGCSGAGSMVMALVLPGRINRWGERFTMLGGAFIAPLAILASAGALSRTSDWISLVLVGCCWFIHGLGWSAIQTPIGRIITREIPNHRLGNAFAARFSLSHAMWLLAYPLAGYLGNYGLSFTALVLSTISALGGLGATLLWTPTIIRREEDALAPNDETDSMDQQSEELDYAVSVLRLLADRTRLSILAMLCEEELSVGVIAERLNRPLPAVSQHLAKLRTAGLVLVRKNGTTSYYSQPDEHLTSLVTNALHFSEHHFSPNPLHHRAQH